MRKYDIELVRQSVSYNPETGEFKRLTPSAPPKVGSVNKNMIVIRVNRGDYVKTHCAWRVAILLSHGYYPDESSACVFKDGNTLNLRLNNIEVLPKADDEFTALEFATDHDMSYQVVSRMMKGAPAVRRTINGAHQLYYKLEDYRARCALIAEQKKEGYRQFKNGAQIRKRRTPSYKSNPQATDFLRTFILPPVRWEWSLR